MQQTSTLYKSILATAGHRKEYRAKIGTATYTGAQIVSASLSWALIGEHAIGSTCSQSMDLTLWGVSSNDIPRRAAISLSYRIVTDTQQSEWLPLGTYYVRYRTPDTATNTIQLRCSDAMLFAEQDFTAYWPTLEHVSMRWVAQRCAARMGVSLEDATQIGSTYPYVISAYPIGYSVRQVLSGIAAAHGGNWIMTVGNKLRFVPLRNNQPTVAIAGQMADLGHEQPLDAYTGVILNFDATDGTTQYVQAGTTIGRVLDVPLRAVTSTTYAQQQANAIMTELSGWTYTPFTATDALIDPAAELGDAISYTGGTGMLVTSEMTLDALYSATISAPGDDEMEDDELGFGPQPERDIERRLAQTNTSLRVLIDGIQSSVEDLDGNVSTLTQTVSGFETRVSTVEGDVTSIRQSVDSITLSVANHTTSSTITLTVDGVEVSSDTITLAGNVVFKSDLTDGTTEISGSNIKTGTIKLHPAYSSGGTGTVIEVYDRFEGSSASLVGGIRYDFDDDEDVLRADKLYIYTEELVTGHGTYRPALKVESAGRISLTSTDADDGIIYVESGLSGITLRNPNRGGSVRIQLGSNVWEFTRNHLYLDNVEVL